MGTRLPWYYDDIQAMHSSSETTDETFTFTRLSLPSDHTITTMMVIFLLYNISTQSWLHVLIQDCRQVQWQSGQVVESLLQE